MKTIRQWRFRSPYFIIAEPNFNGPFKIGETIQLERKDDNGNTLTMEAEIVDHWTDPMIDPPPWLSQFAYGYNEKELFLYLRDKYPKMTRDTEIKFLFLKQL